jgi:hypothetical protein
LKAAKLPARIRGRGEIRRTSHRAGAGRSLTGAPRLIALFG